MSRTYRTRPTRCFRSPRTQQSRVVELMAVDSLTEEGLNPSNRVKSRLNNLSSSWDDIGISAWYEIPKCKW